MAKYKIAFTLKLFESVTRRSFHLLPSVRKKWEFPRTSFKMGCASSKIEINPSRDSGEMAAGLPDDDYVEGVVCQDVDIRENEMKAFDLEDAGRVLVVRQKGILSALGDKCTHYGAPLVTGVLGDGRVRCPWHGACFNIATGDIEDFPGLDSLPCYQVTVANGDVVVRAKRSLLAANKRTKPTPKTAPDSSLCCTLHYVIIGGGPSGATCVETLRQEGFTGTITFVCRENHLPYDRVKVSKAMDFDIEKAQFRTPEFYAAQRIDVIKGVAATAVNTTQKTVTLSNNTTLSYDKLYVATGSSALKAAIPGAELENVHTLREYEDSQKVYPLLNKEKHVVVLGGSFVAMEAASFAVNKVQDVTVVGRGKVPFKALVGEAVGAAYMKLFEDKGVNFIMNSGMTRCIAGEGGAVAQVELTDGRVLPADLVIMGVGGACNTAFLKGSGVELRADGSVETDDLLQTNVGGVFVGGDIAHAPVWSHGNAKSTIGHYPLAHYHGRVAALNMLGRGERLKAVPFFWTQVFGKSLRYAGHGKYDSIVLVGNVEALKFVGYYLDGDEVVAVSSTGMDPVVAQFAELLAQGKKLWRKDVEGDEEFKWAKQLCN